MTKYQWYRNGEAIRSYSTPEGVVTCDMEQPLTKAQQRLSYSTPEGVVTCDRLLHQQGAGLAATKVIFHPGGRCHL